jgi:hypothetical protein
MTTLEQRHPLTAIRTRSRRPASLLTVMPVAAVALALAVAAALLTEVDGDSVNPAAQSAARSGGPQNGPPGTGEGPGSTDRSRPPTRAATWCRAVNPSPSPDETARLCPARPASA